MKEFFEKISNHFLTLEKNYKSHVGFVLSFLAIIAALFLIAFILERIAAKKRGVNEKIFTTRKIAMIGMFSAISTILMMIEIPMPFAPPFYKLDFSELPILIGTFAFGPASGVMMEFIKILLKLLIKGTSTAFVGELANFAVGCSFIITASVIYDFKKSKKAAIIACVGVTLFLTLFGTAFNAVYLLPAFAELYGMPLEAILAEGAKVNKLCNPESIVSFVIVCVAPLNLIKGLANSIIVLLVYKPLSPIIKGNRSETISTKTAKNVVN